MRYFLAGLTALLAVCGSGCGRGATSPTATTTSDGQQSQAPAATDAARQSNALVRFVNGDPSGKPRELWMDDQRVAADVTYKAITPYTEVRTKAAKFHIRETNGQEDLASVRVEFFAGWRYTLIAGPRKDGSADLIEVRDELDQPKPGRAKVRMINMTRGVEDLDLYVAGTKKKLQKGVDESGSTRFREVDPGTYAIEPAHRPPPPQLAKLVVEPDRLYTFIVLGKPGNLDLVSIEDRLTAEASVR